MTPVLSAREAAASSVDEVMDRLGSSRDGLTSAEALRRAAEIGPNALAVRRTTVWRVLLNQFRNPLLPLLVMVAAVSGLTGQRTDAVIIIVIAALSVLLGVVSEYRSERALEELHDQIRHRATAIRDATAARIDITDLVPGDVVVLGIGDVVPADVRLLEADGLEIDESVLTGESVPVEKSVEPRSAPAGPLELPSCALMGTVVRSGLGRGVVVSTGDATEFGAVARQLGESRPPTSFQRGLRDVGNLLVRVTALLVVAIFAINVALGRPLIDALLFSLAIAIGLTPQMLPAIVTISLSAGARRMARERVLVRRLVAIEDFGNIEVLFTDKTGTLTEGTITFREANAFGGRTADEVFRLALVCSDVVLEDGKPTGGSALDQALWTAVVAGHAGGDGWSVSARLPFDYERRRMSVVADGPAGRVMITKGAPEAVLGICGDVPAAADERLRAAFADGDRVIAVATKPADDLRGLSGDDERDLTFAGFVTFADPPRADAAGSLQRLAQLGIDVRVITGDNEVVAATVCRALGIEVRRTLTGAQIEGLPDEELAAAAEDTTIFARVSPDEKARIVRLAREHGRDVGFMGDGVNDAIALHEADVGISVDSATDVAKDAADILLLEKDLGTLARGVTEGRRVYANTMKYLLMATSSNFGNMFSAAAASAFLSFLPMLPTQILLNNLLYDASQTPIPTDEVDAEQLRRPAHWDTALIRRFMAFFGPISSLFDFATFAVMLGVFHAGPSLFRTGWFVESLLTQTLVIFVIRTRRIPFIRSRPSRLQMAATLTCAALALVLPYVPPVADALGFTPLPLSFLAIVTGFVVAYLGLAEAGKAWFFRRELRRGTPIAAEAPEHRRRLSRRASPFRRSAVS